MSPELIAILMFVVLVIFLFMGHPLAFVLAGVGILFGLFGLGFNTFGMFMNRIYGTMDNFVLVAITLFILMGNFLTMSGVAEELFKKLRVLLGPIAGGVGLAVIVVCIIFAACTGIIGASVVTMGLLAGPLLIKYGYQKEMTMGMVAAGGSLGILIPPSIMLVMMADQAAMSAGKLLMSGVIPGVILGVLYMIYIGVRCKLNPEHRATDPEGRAGADSVQGENHRFPEVCVAPDRSDLPGSGSHLLRHRHPDGSCRRGIGRFVSHDHHLSEIPLAKLQGLHVPDRQDRDHGHDHFDRRELFHWSLPGVGGRHRAR